MKIARSALALSLLLLFVGCRRTPSVESLLSNESTLREKSLERLAVLPLAKKDGLIQPLMDALASEDPRLSQRAGKALAVIGSSAVPALVVALRDGGLFLKLNVLETLSEMGPDASPATEELIAATKHSHPLVRAEAVAALGSLSGPQAEAVAAAKALLKDQDPGVREAAEQTLGKWNGTNARSEIDKQPTKSA